MNRSSSGILPTSGVSYCRLVRHRDGTKSVYQEFELFEEDGSGQARFLLAAKKIRAKPSKYVISSEHLESDRFYENSIVKMVSNYVGTRFKVYQSTNSSDHFRMQIASIIYGTNILGIMGPRRMKILIPSFYPFGQIHNNCIYVKNKDVILEAHKSKSHNILLLQNKEPVWNDETRSYVLNFGGRVTKPSVKNFQVISDHDPDFCLAQFGRTGENSFSLDFQDPITAGLAFAIALTSIDSKLACE